MSKIRWRIFSPNDLPSIPNAPALETALHSPQADPADFQLPLKALGVRWAKEGRRQRLEEWKNGKMEEWNHGMMEYWE
jgi:hypothetical protein